MTKLNAYGSSHAFQSAAARCATSFLRKLAVVEDVEVEPLFRGAAAYFFCLAGYFVLQPLRDDTAVALGTHNLPWLFVMSLIATALISPATSSYIVNHTPRKSGRAVRNVYRSMAVVTAGFYAVFLLGEFLQSTTAGIQKHISTEGSESLAGEPRGESLYLVQQLEFWSHAAFYIWVTLMNVLATSTMWSRLADVFTSDAGARLFGLVGAGATMGQLFGSLLAGTWASVVAHNNSNNQFSAVAMNGLLLVASFFMEIAGLLVSRVTLPRRVDLPRTASGDADVDKAQPEARPSSHMRALQEGLRLIWSSGYLIHLCSYLLMHSFISSMFYFTKTLVVARSRMGSSSRTAWFASINSASAFLIFVLQLTATGRVLHGMGIAAALAFTPAMYGLLTAAVALHPRPSTVAFADIVRRLSTYVVSRPAREVLFTVVTREEKYKAKVIIDTVVARLGDTTAAAVFSLLDSEAVGAGIFGPSLVASVASVITWIWALVAFLLGTRQKQLARMVNPEYRSSLEM